MRVRSSASAATETRTRADDSRRARAPLRIRRDAPATPPTRRTMKSTTGSVRFATHVVVVILLLFLARVPAARATATPAISRAASSSSSHTLALRPRAGSDDVSHRRETDAMRATRRRLLSDASSAHDASATMPVRGSLREHGYHYAEVALGTFDPPRFFQVIVDTGSSYLYVPCGDCGEKCGTHTNATYDLANSTTGLGVLCTDRDCPTTCPRARGRGRRRRRLLGADGGGDVPRCEFSASYAEMSSVRGRVVRDRIHLGEEIGAVDVTFGCTMEEKGSIFRQEADGLMGMGRANDMSMPVQLSRRHGLADVFSLCYNNFTGGGALTFGRAKGMGDGEAHADHPENSLGFTPLKRTGNKNFYGVDVESMTMNGETFGTEAEFAVGRGSVMDSGTTMTYVPASVFKKLTKALQDAAEKNKDDKNLKLEKVAGPDPKYPDDVCYANPTATWDNVHDFFPNLTITFKGGVALETPPGNYLFAHGKDPHAFCLGIMANGNAGALIGAISTRDVFVQYDVENSRIGFAKTDCASFLATHTTNMSFAAEPKYRVPANDAPDFYDINSEGPPIGFILVVVVFLLAAVGFCYVKRRGEVRLPWFGRVEWLSNLASDVETGGGTTHARGRGKDGYARFADEEDGDDLDGGEVELPRMDRDRDS